MSTIAHTLDMLQEDIQALHDATMRALAGSTVQCFLQGTNVIVPEVCDRQELCTALLTHSTPEGCREFFKGQGPH